MTDLYSTGQGHLCVHWVSLLFLFFLQLMKGGPNGTEKLQETNRPDGQHVSPMVGKECLFHLFSSLTDDSNQPL